MQAHNVPHRHLQVVSAPAPASGREPASIKRAVHQHRRQMARRRQTEAIVELGVKLTVNLAIIAVASTAMVRLVDYHSAQRSRLAEARQELQDAEQRLQIAQESFSRHFDPQQTGTIMQEQTNRLSSQQRQIVWVDRYSSTPAH